MVLMGYSGARGTLIYKKNLISKISCQTPFKGVLTGVRCTKSSRVLFLHRRPPSWTTLVLYPRAVFIFNEPAYSLMSILACKYCTYGWFALCNLRYARLYEELYCTILYVDAWLNVRDVDAWQYVL